MSQSMHQPPESSPHTPNIARVAAAGEKLGFADLGESIIESLSIGVVAFDDQLKILQFNTQAAKLITLTEYIDESLSKGTDAKIWSNWTELLKSAIAIGKKSEFESVRYTIDSQKKLLHILCTPLTDTHSHKPIGGALVVEDVTTKVDIENQLVRAERLAAIGKVAGKVAHELNNPMDGILRYMNLAMRMIDGSDPEKAKEYIQQSHAGLMRMVQIISELLEFSRSTYSAFEYAPIDKIVADAVKAMQSRVDSVKVRIVHDCVRQVPKLRSNSLFQVFCNLIKNAADAMEGVGELTITVTCPEDVLCIEFADTGPGFAPENSEAIFEPFFTTKTDGKGTGLGLAICKDLIEKYDGRIVAENAPDGGGIFTVNLPLDETSSLVE
ncbi:MAG: GHKL domain-containing protein [Planctomycetes bacterium]|nr:GHKL domain-containing protein [Planctomycetota bacterium]